MGWLRELLAGLGKPADQSSRSSTDPSKPMRRPPPHAEPRSGSAGLGSPNPLVGKRLRYKIGADNPGKGEPDEIVEVGYDWGNPLPLCISVAYCNLFNEKYSEQSKKERA